MFLYRVDALGDSTDTAGFMLLAGVPCYDAYYTHNSPVDSYPLYHTVYDGFTLYDKILDPDYQVYAINFTLALPLNPSGKQTPIKLKRKLALTDSQGFPSNYKPRGGGRYTI